MVLLNIFLNLLLVVLPFGVLFRFQLAPDVFFYPHDIIMFGIFSILIFRFFKNKKFPQVPFFNSLLIFFIFAFISLLLNLLVLSSSQFLVALLYLFRFLIYSSLLFVFSILKNKAFDYYKKLSISGLIFIFFGIIQYHNYNNLANLRYLNWDIHMYRLFSTVLDPNFAGAIIIIEIFLLLGLFIKKINEGAMRIVTLFLLFLSVIAMLLTYSRSTLLAFIAGCITFFVLSKKLKELMFFAAIIFIAILIIPKDFTIESMDLFRKVSSIGRLNSFSDSLVVFMSSPIYGVGFNAYRYAQHRLGLLDSLWLTTHAGSGVSNSYLFVLATTGVVGFGIFVYFLYKLLKFLYLKKSNDAMNNSAIAAFAGILMHSLFDNTLFFPFVTVWLFFLLGVAVSSHKRV